MPKQGKAKIQLLDISDGKSGEVVEKIVQLLDESGRSIVNVDFTEQLWYAKDVYDTAKSQLLTYGVKAAKRYLEYEKTHQEQIK